ncbi:MAG TPA: hypothetical protein VFW07_07345 [Parafilimonas sp.]|nr:hypothetical protein [Parafilimonas sp.]
MKAEEVFATVDEKGILHADKLLNFKNQKVKLIVLAQDDDISDKEWMKFLASNPAFDFLKNEAEDIYTIHDGKPYNSER